MGIHAAPSPENAPPWHIALARRLRRSALLTAAAGAGAVAVGAFTYASVTFALNSLGPGGSAHDWATRCAGASCRSARAVPAPPDFTLPAHTPRPSASASPHLRQSPQPAANLSREAAAGPDVSVSFSAGRRRPWGFVGRLTIVNNSDGAISGWRIVITLPGDQVSSISNAIWQMNGGVLVLEPASPDPPIQPGGQQTVSFRVSGPTTSPSSCTYNGASCE